VQSNGTAADLSPTKRLTSQRKKQLHKITPKRSTTMSGSPETSRLQFFPISWFAVVMGMAGFSIAWSRAEHLFALPVAVSPLLLAVTAALFILICIVYGIKIGRYPEDVRAELTHPVKIAFLPTISISMILLSIAFLPLGKSLSLALWGWAAACTLSSPSMSFPPGCIRPPSISNTSTRHGSFRWSATFWCRLPACIMAGGTSWFFFSIGLFFWPILTAIIFYRLIFHQSLPERLMPTLFIFIAPPAVALLSWFNLTAAVGHLGNIFYYIAVFFFLLLLSQLASFSG
jgi:tellurite resistance protein